MSTSKKHPNTIRQGGPGASHENAKEPLEINKPGEDSTDRRATSSQSTGGGEKDKRHSHNPAMKD
jgi:hypothetical protein